MQNVSGLQSQLSDEDGDRDEDSRIPIYSNN
jgi:hypothetical protein